MKFLADIMKGNSSFIAVGDVALTNIIHVAIDVINVVKVAENLNTLHDF